MPNDRNALKAGLFIVLSIVLIFAVIVGIKGIGRIIEPQQTRQVVFGLGDDVGGLRVGDDVRVGGVKVGIIRSLTIEPGSGEESPARIVIDFRMPQRIVLRQGARVGVQGTITGSSWLNFDALGSGEPLPADQSLQGRPGSFAVLLKTVNDLAPQVQQLAADLHTKTLPKIDSAAGNVAALAGDVRGRIDPVMSHYNNVTDRLAEVMVKIRDLLGDSTPDIRGALSNANAVTGTLKEKLPPAMDKADALLAKLNQSVDKAQGALADLSVTMDHAKAISASLRSLIVQNRSRLDEMIFSAKQASDNLKFATEEIRRSPWRLLYKPRPNEMANLNLFDATRSFSRGAGQLSDASSALRDALKDPNADPKLIQKLIDQLDQSFDQFQKVEQTLWERVKQ
jgi:ABC-type transporter Mla subunit MlaD